MQQTNAIHGCGRLERARGFTLIELLVTFALIAIMLTLAAPSFVTFQQNSQLTSTANAFLASLSAARAEAMKRQLNAFVRPLVGNDWTQGWRVYIDGNWDNVYTTGGTDVQISQQAALPSGITVAASASFTADGTSGYVEISGAGFVISDTGGGLVASQGITFTNVNGSRLVIVDGSGRLRVCTPPVGTSGDQSCVVGTF